MSNLWWENKQRFRHRDVFMLFSCSVMSDSFVNPRIVARQAPLSMRFPREEYWSGLPCPFSRGFSQPRDRTCVSCIGRWILYHWATWETHRDVCMRVCVLSRFSRVWLFVTLWTVACQAPLSKRLSRQEYWSRLPCPPPGDIPNPGIKPLSLMSPALADEFFTIRAPGKPTELFTTKLFTLVRFP